MQAQASIGGSSKQQEAALRFGSGDYRYELVPDWAKLPAGWLCEKNSGIAVDSDDNVYALSRGEHPVLVFDRHGNFLRSWGEGVFARSHGISISDEAAFCADDMDHTIRRFDLHGRLLETMGTKGQPSDTGYVLPKKLGDPGLLDRLLAIKRGAGPFNRPTKLIVAPWGERYATDGYGNARVHRFAADGSLIQSWGQPGTGAGQFCLPHSLVADARERILVADRENSRVQVFSKDGKFLEEWRDFSYPSDIAIGGDGVLFISEKGTKGVSIRDLDGKVLSQFSGEGDGVLRGAHSICVDSSGDLYIGETAAGSPSIKKFVRV